MCELRRLPVNLERFTQRTARSRDARHDRAYWDLEQVAISRYFISSTSQSRITSSSGGESFSMAAWSAAGGSGEVD